MKEETQDTISEKEQINTSLQTGDRTRWLLGIVICIGGIVCLILWGLLSLFNPAASNQLSESSMISIDGNGIFLILCIVAIVAGALLLLKNSKDN